MMDRQPVEHVEVTTVPRTDWVNAIKTINKCVQRIRTIVNVPVVPYISEWHERYNTLRQLADDNPDSTLQDAAALLFTNPSTLHAFCTDLIKIVPPLKEIITVERLDGDDPDTVILRIIRNPSAPIVERIMTTHQFWHRPQPPPPDPNKAPDALEINSDSDDAEIQISSSNELSITRIAPGLKEQVEDMEQHIHALESEIAQRIQTSVDASINSVTQKIDEKIDHAIQRLTTANFDETIDATIKRTAEKASTSAQAALMRNNDSLRDSVLLGTRTAERLQGDIKRATETITRFQQQTQEIASRAADIEKHTTAKYLEAKQHMEQTRDNVIQQITTAAASVRPATPVPDTTTSAHMAANHIAPPRRHKYADEYDIKGQTVQVRTKKFQEDTTPIKCDGVDELLGMYNLLAQVAHQYGIHLAPVTSLDIWKDPGITKPPTFPYTIDDFTSPEAFRSAYSSMSLALATKLKTSVQFSPSFTAVHLSIDDYANDGYVNLYHLVSMSHHKLQRKKFVRHTKPEFEGNMFQFIAKYKNYILYNQTRQVAHVFDDDEIAEDVIEAVRQSRWKDSLKQGLDEVETKLDRWKNDSFDNPTPFPFELRLEFIGRSILDYYIARNINPLADTPRARPAQIRGRSRTRQQDRSRSQSRRSQSSNGNGRRETRPCEICGGNHLVETIGCPNAVRQYHLNNYFQTRSPQEIRRMVDSVERARSQSRDSRRSESRDSRSHPT